MPESWGIVAGATVDKSAFVRIIQAVKGGDENAVAIGITGKKTAVKKIHQACRRSSGARMQMGDGMSDGHDDGGGWAVATYIGDEQSPASIADIEDIVIIAARPAAGSIKRRQVQARNLRH